MVESIEELKKICQDSKSEAMDWYSKMFYRSISIHITKLLLRTSVTANQVTFFTIVLGLIAGVLFSFGTHSYMLAGALLLQLWLIFDCVDGEIARYKGTAGICGKYMESLDHYVTEPFIIACVGFGLYVLFDNVVIFALGALVALLMSSSFVSSNLIYTLFVMHKITNENIYRMSGAITDNSTTIRCIYNFCFKSLTTPTSFMVILLIATMLDILFIAFCPDIAIGGLTIAFGPDMNIIHLTGIFDHKLHFNFLYIYFIFFSIVSITRSIVRMLNNFQEVCQYQRNAKQRQS